MPDPTLLGLRTIVYRTPDLARGKEWFSSLLGVAPYFDQPFYVGFNVGGFELGLLPDDDGMAVTYWGVAKMSAVWPRLLELGATPVTAPQDVGDGILVASARDPFGNLIGLIENPHYPNTA